MSAHDRTAATDTPADGARKLPRAERDSRMAAALIAGSTHEEAARRGGVSTRTLRRRLNDPAFRSMLNRARRDVLGEVANRLAAESVRSVEALASIRDDAEAGPSARVSAAREILSRYLIVVDVVDLADRLEAVEAALDARPGPVGMAS